MRIVTHRTTMTIVPADSIWQAWDDSTYDGPECALGSGPTEIEAIADLFWHLDLDLDPAEFLPHEPEARA